MAIRLRVQEFAQQEGISMSALARKADVGGTTMQRMWHNTGNGNVSGPPLENVNLPALERIADVLGVEPGALIERVK